MVSNNTTRLPRVAYFCMEYGLHEEFPIYSGGLGILAGDHLKSAGELGMPLVGVGLLWRHGYTSQFIGADGRPYDVYPEYGFDCLKDTGVKVSVQIRGRDVACKVWRVDKYGNAPLYLLDTDLPENEERWIAGYLYGGYGSADRVAQEIVLGIGGVRALRALGLEVDTYHFNEGHAVLAGVELIREKMDQGESFEAAWAKTREQIVFTTHTPVLAGNESHELDVMAATGAFDGLSWDQMARLGGSPFGMTVAGLRLSRLANAVAQLHGETSRQMWRDITGASEIIAITNGVHANTWQSAGIRHAFENGQDLRPAHDEAKRALLAEIKLRTNIEFNPEVLLVGFARRAAEYKRADLIFRDVERIEPLLAQGKIQIVLSGKAHPRDDAGKGIIANLVNMAKRFPGRVVFIENYDMKIGRLLTRGCDVWLNNPRRPLEASGTSGMKAAMNGVLNLSVLDGWWPEGCVHGVNGWQIGDGFEGPAQDENDLKSLNRILAEEVMPTYYGDRAKWSAMMRASVEMSHYRFSTNRMVREYFERLYAAEAVASRMAERLTA